MRSRVFWSDGGASFPMMSKPSVFNGRALPLILLGLICLITVFASNRTITPSWISWDGRENYEGAYSLLVGRPAPEMQLGENRAADVTDREPLPQMLLAGWLYAVFPALDEAALKRLNGKPESVRVKRFNLVWAVVIVLSAYAATFLLTGSAVGGLVAAAICGWLVSTWTHALNSMYTEPVAAAFILLTGVAAIIVIQSRSIWAAVAFGATFACLALSRSIAAPIFFVAAPLLGLLAVSSGLAWRRAGMLVLVSALVFGAIAGPWMARDASPNDSIGTATRSAKVLYLRMLINEMPPEAYRMAFYVWSPPEVRRILEHLFGFGPADLEKEGAGQWLSRDLTFRKIDERAWKLGKPELAVTHVYKLRAELVKRAKKLAAQGMSPGDAKRAAHSSLGAEAKSRIFANLPAHFKAMIPLAWRGLWPLNAPYWLTATEPFAPPFWLAPLLALSLPTLLVWAIFAWRPDAFAFGMVPFGMLLAYLLITQFHDRYITAMVPLMCVSLVVLGHAAFVSAQRRWTRSKAPAIA